MSMDDFNFEDTDDEMDEMDSLRDASQPEESSNRTFLLVAGILGAIMILSLILMAVYAMLIVPGRNKSEATQLADINAQNTQVALAAKLTAEARRWTATPTITKTAIPDTPTPSSTPVLVEEATNTPVSDGLDDPRTATVAALFTQQAEALLTTTPGATALPDTGFADDVGIPGLLTLAGILVLVVFLARRLRTTP
ncbi:MAG: hypothetical protein ABFS03_06025 [Chloroflexota bacterium]